MPECKTVECCDLDDFPETSSSDGNCPVGWYWDGTSCVRCEMPAAPTLEASPGIITLTFTTTLGANFRIERHSDAMWEIVLNAVGTGGSELYDDTTVVVGTAYQYRIVVELSEECGYIAGEPASAVAI